MTNQNENPTNGWPSGSKLSERLKIGAVKYELKAMPKPIRQPSELETFKTAYYSAEACAMDATKQAITETVEKYGEADIGPCGHAWVELPGIRKNSKIGQWLEQMGHKKHGDRFTIWKPGGFNGQALHILEAGAKVFSETLQYHGFLATFSSRLD